MRLLEAEVVDVLWATIEPLLPPPERTHPLGCHRPRVPDRLCFRGLLIRLVTGSSWVDIEAILDHQVSDTTLRARRDEWIDAGVFDQLEAEALAAFDRIIGSTWTTSRSTGRCTRPHTAARAPARAQPTGRSSAGSGRSRRRARHPDRLGHRRREPQRRPPAGPHPRRRRSRPACSSTSRRCTSTAGYDYPDIRARLADAGTRSSSTSRSAAPRPRGREAPAHARAAMDRRSHQHRGGRTTGSSAATPTARSATATPPSASPPPCSSSADSSTTATDAATMLTPIRSGP